MFLGLNFLSFIYFELVFKDLVKLLINVNINRLLLYYFWTWLNLGRFGLVRLFLIWHVFSKLDYLNVRRLPIFKMFGPKSIAYDIPAWWIYSLALWRLHWAFRGKVNQFFLNLVLWWHIVLVHCSYWAMIHLRYNAWGNMTVLLFIDNKRPMIMVHNRGRASKLFLSLWGDIIPCQALARVQVSVTVLKGFPNVVAIRDWLLLLDSGRGSISFCLVTPNIVDSWLSDSKLNVQYFRPIHFQRFLLTLAIPENWGPWLVHFHSFKIYLLICWIWRILKFWMLQWSNRHHRELCWAHLPPFWWLLYGFYFWILLSRLLDVRIDAVICAQSLIGNLSRVLKALKRLVD